MNVLAAILSLIASGDPPPAVDGVIAVARPGPPWVELRVASRGGAGTDPREKSGLAHVVSIVLARRLEALETRPEVQLGRRGISAAAAAPRDRIERLALQTADLLAKEVTDSEVDAAVSRAADRRKRVIEDDRALADAELDRVLFGEEGLSPLGSVEEIASITRDDVQSFIRRWWTIENLRLVLVGDVDEPVRDKVRARLANLERPARGYAPSFRAAARRDGTHVVLVDKPDRRRATILIGRAITRRPGDQEANAAIGGCMSSVATLAMQKGGVAGIVASEVAGDRFVVSALVDPSAVVTATSRLVEALDSIAKTGLSPDEVLLGERTVGATRALSRRSASAEADAISIAWISGAVEDPAPKDAIVAASKALADTRGVVIVIVGSATGPVQSGLLAMPGVKNVEVVRYDLR